MLFPTFTLMFFEESLERQYGGLQIAPGWCQKLAVGFTHMVILTFRRIGTQFGIGLVDL
jgi:hypothetical protein